MTTKEQHVSEMIENIPTPLVSFAGSGLAGFFMGMFLRRTLKFLVESLSVQVSSSHILGTLGIPATSGLAIGLMAGLAKS